ncbi:MAG: S8 family serine peptidase, partial [Pyrinomonadaceae bacterium]
MSDTGADVAPLAELLESEGVRMEPLFGVSEERLRHSMAALRPAPGTEVPDLSVYYRVEAPDERLDELAARLREQESVEAAYVKPPAEPAAFLNDMAPLAEDAPPATPDFVARQRYLEAAPAGVDARFAWTQGGGSGGGVHIIDLEWSWRFSHEDLRLNQGGVVGGVAAGSANHGTAVIGEISGDRNSFGVTGICPDAVISAVAFSMPTAAAIRLAADRLRAGDIMLLEIHRAGPRHNFQPRSDQRGYIAVEWWPDDFDAIRYAVARGVIVVEAAGNGAENLDDAIYNQPAPGFPPAWTNPFSRTRRDSGAVVVGAGNPPAGTHGRNSHPTTGEAYVDRARCGFSNFGGLIDAQGWGWEVTTCGYGDLQGGNTEDLWYTDQFSGTSSASPIVVGALGSVQGILRARGRTPLTPAQARQC